MTMRRVWVDRLRVKLRPLLRGKDVRIWEDSYIGAGARWDAAIRDANLRARVAVLFVSENFRRSECASGRELALLREQLAKGRLRILWLPLDDTRPDVPEQELQAAHDPERPLGHVAEAEFDEALRVVVSLIADSLESQTAPA